MLSVRSGLTPINLSNFEVHLLTVNSYMLAVRFHVNLILRNVGQSLLMRFLKCGLSNLRYLLYVSGKLYKSLGIGMHSSSFEAEVAYVPNPKETHYNW